jgi:hypothetical protein
VHGLILTRLEHLEVIGLVPADLKKSVKRTRQALDATIPEVEGDPPDHAIRLRAADQFFKLADAYPKRDGDAPDSSRPIAVQIVLTGTDTRAALQTHGVRLHLSEHNGDSA